MGNAAPDDKEYAVLLVFQCVHGTCLSAFQPGIKVQPLDLLHVLHGTENHCIVKILGQDPSPVDIVGQKTCMIPTVALTPWPGPILVSRIRVFLVMDCL